jgi:hypothetical protein
MRCESAHESSGFVPETRRQVLATLRPLVVPDCPFTSLPQKDKAAREPAWFAFPNFAAHSSKASFVELPDAARYDAFEGRSMQFLSQAKAEFLFHAAPEGNQRVQAITPTQLMDNESR